MSDLSTVEILRAAKALIDTPEKWCQGTEALDALGRATEGDDPKAVRRCSGGAIRAHYPHPLGAPYQALADAMGTSYCTHGNDTLTHTGVMAAFDRAIAAES